jgi:large subunit ribosomal protein L9
VGDVVSVKPGHARNYLLPRGLATEPSQELIDQLAEKRAAAKAELDRLRAAREKMVGELEGIEVATVKACNEQGLLYGSVTQQEIADLLNEKGYEIRRRDVRIGEVIKRIGEFDVLIKPENDLEATITLKVEPENPEILDDQLDDEEEAQLSDVAAGVEPAAETSVEGAEAQPAGEGGEAEAEPAKG